MSITITINGENAEHVRYEMEKLLDIVPRTITSALSDVSPDKEGGLINDYRDTPVVIGNGTPAPTPTPTRRRGRPAKLPEGPALNVVANISTGGERVDPETPAGNPAVDMTPPAAETVAVIGHAFPEPPAEETKVYTLDDARHAAKPYILKYTMAAAAADLQSILEESVGVRAISKINPNDQAQVKKAIDALAASVNTPGPVALKLMADEAAKKAATEAKVA